MALAICAGAAEPARRDGNVTVLLIESDQPDGATTFKDASPYAHEVGRVGDTHHSARQRKLGRSAIYFDGEGDHLTVADHPAFSFGVDDFAVEFWLLPEGRGRRFVCGQAPADGANKRSSVGIAIEEDGRLRGSAHTAFETYLLFAPRRSYDDGKWHHVKFCRDGDQLRLLVDGAEHDCRRIGPEPLRDATEPFAVGRAGAFAADPYHGFLDGFVITRRTRATPAF